MGLDRNRSSLWVVKTATIAALLMGCLGNFETDPCRGVTCSGHGVCLDNDDVGVCLCDPGYSPSESRLECVADGTDGDGDSDVDADVDGDIDSDADGEPCTPTTEICNELDDDCDGAIDEGFDLESDPENCGRCGHSCPADPLNASSRCVSSGCIVECDPGTVNCNDDLDDGCETRLGTPEACSECGEPCPPDLPLCEYTPELGYICVNDCVLPSVACSGSCVNLVTNPAHCGECGNECSSPPHASPTCSGGECSSECDSGFGDCATTVDDGCETSLMTVDNCGSCGYACWFDHADPRCSDGDCLLESCHEGWGNCVLGDVDGCETPLNTVTDCGDCGIPCLLENAEESCEAGACTLMSCLPGFDDCDSAADTGCETDLTTATNCGACSNTCTADEVCGGGGCEPSCPASCECEQTCADSEHCDCRDGCPCDITCIGDCEIDCVDSETLCTIDATRAENPERIECQRGATCIVDATGGDLGNDFRCEDNDTTCDIDCTDGLACEVRCRLGASCMLDCTGALYCNMDRCDGPDEVCPDGVLVCNRPCP